MGSKQSTADKEKILKEITASEKAKNFDITLEEEQLPTTPPKGFFSVSNKPKSYFLTNSKKDIEDSKKFILEDHKEIKSVEGLCEVIESRMTLFHNGKGYSRKEGGKSVFYAHVKLTGKNVKPKALVFAFHGLGSLFDVEAKWATYFAKKGIEVIGFDQPQFGRTVKKEDVHKDFGPPALIDDYENLLKNGIAFIEQFYEEQKERYVDVPFFLWGQSMGGSTCSGLGIMMKEVWKEKKELLNKFKGAIKSCPAYESQLKPNWTMTQMLKVLSKVYPNFRFIGKVIVCSRIKETHNNFANHPLTAKGIKIGTGLQVLLLTDYVNENVKKFDMPVLFFVGEKDNMVKPKAIVKYFKEISSKDKSLIVWNESLHALTVEYNAKKQADYTIEWILNRCNPRKL